MQLVTRRDHSPKALTRFLLAVTFAATLIFGLVVDIRTPGDAVIQFDQLSRPGHDFAGNRSSVPTSRQSSSIA